MSAETLRQAAEHIHLDARIAYERGHISLRECAFKRAVGDLLEQIAESDFQDLGFAETCTSVGSEALIVANAYLGATP